MKTPRQKKREIKIRNSLLIILMFLAVCEAIAQTKMISGRVTEVVDRQPLPGVNVLIKGSTIGTVTDQDGKYAITLSESASALVFSFIGFQTLEVSIGVKEIIDVQLVADVTQLSEVVITGTGVATEKRKLAISVESVTAEKLPQAPTASIDQALVGKIPGAQISSVSGDPGAQVQILLRGINTIQRGTTPMILVDGVQMGPTALNTLDLASVESVEVVQGAAAATIYGAQGANGVIQIITKRGKPGKVSVDFSTSFAQNEFLNVGNLRKANLHAFKTDANNNVVTAADEIITLNPEDLTWSGSIVYDALNPNSNANKPYGANFKFYDHFNQFFTKANTTNNLLRLSGGKDKFDFSVSVSNNRQEATIKNGGAADRTNLTSNLGFEIAKGLTFRSITQMAYTENTVNHYIFGVFNSRPFVNFDEKDADGDYGANYGGAGGVNGYNPNYYNQYTDDITKTVDVIQSFDATYKFPKFVEISSKFGINYQNRERIYSAYNQTENNNNQAVAYYWTGFYVDDETGEIDNFRTETTLKNSITKAVIDFDLAEDFKLNIPLRSSTLLLFDYRKNNQVNYTTYGQGLPTYSPYTAANASTFRIVQGVNNTGTIPFVTYGYLVNQRFEYADFLGISAGFRTDYSSAFGEGSKPFTFPRGDAFFRLSGLNFWDNSGIGNAILDFKLRAAYGEAGIQPFAFDRYVTLPSGTIGENSIFKLPITSANPGLNVEVSKETEFGFDMVLNVLDNTTWLNNITLSGTYWDRKSDDVIYNVDAAPSTGVGNLKTNAFSLASNGLQFSLSTKAFHNAAFTWNFTTNFGKATSEITGVKGDAEIVLISNAGSTNYVLRAGEKIGQLYGYKILTSVNQVNPNTGEPFIPAGEQSKYSVASNGFVVETATKQPYFTADLFSFGDPNPNFNMSFINDFTYKRWLSFGFQIDMVNGSHLYNQTKEWMYRDGIHSDYNNPIAINGETGNWTAFYRGVYAQRAFNGTKDYFYEDASFVRLRNVNLAVDIAQLAKIPGVRLFQIVFTGRNLWTKTDYTGFDPEISSGALNSAWDRGTDHNTMPNLKTYQIGLNLGL
jgi:TonB-linked SusC/RagA family outer membrane protein